MKTTVIILVLLLSSVAMAADHEQWLNSEIGKQESAREDERVVRCTQTNMNLEVAFSDMENAPDQESLRQFAIRALSVARDGEADKCGLRYVRIGDKLQTLIGLLPEAE